jgi:exportin-7
MAWVQSFGNSEKVISMTLSLFKDLTAGYMSGKLLSKLNASSFILSNNNPSRYAFLNNVANARNRTMFYATLARMIFVEDCPSKFKAFITPLQQVFEMLHQASNGSTDVALLRRQSSADAVAGLFRDLHGVAQATISRRDYMLFFDWIYPQYFPTICKCLEAWTDTPLVTTPLLKFMVEFVSNKGQCMVFETSSPNGILLFREISQILVIYSSSLLVRSPCSSLVPSVPACLLVPSTLPFSSATCSAAHTGTPACVHASFLAAVV